MGLDADTIEGLPLKKRATTQSLILLAIVTTAIFAAGVMAKGYFDDQKAQILTAISGVSTLSQETAKQVQAIKLYYWSRDDQIEWAEDFRQASRTAIPTLVVPPVPRIPLQPQ